MLANVPRELPWIAKFRVEHFFIFDSLLLLFYTGLVYAWGLTVHPMGRDYAVMASEGKDLPFLANWIFAWEMQTFGASPVPYHIVNVFALYGCVWCVMHLTSFTVRGIWWMGTWAAAIFMANPVHTESVLNISGIGDTIPAFFALLAITAYSYHAYKPRKWTYAFALAAFAFAVTPYPHHAFLFLIIVMFEVLITRPENRNFPRLLPFVVMGVAATVVHWSVIGQTPIDVAAWFVPLYFTFYPIGFLPESAAAMHDRPWLGWCAVIAVVAILTMIYRKARRPAILFALLSMLVVRLFPSGRTIDPVHLVGGGELIVATGLFTVGFAALAFRCMDHPKWKVPIVGMTTVFAVAVFLVQIRAELHWRAASNVVKTFQSSAIAASERSDGSPIGILPDWRYFRSAPVQLSESIRFDTPFSRAVAHESVFELNAPSLAPGSVTLDTWSTSGGSLSIAGVRPSEVITAPYTALAPGDSFPTSSGSVVLKSADAPGITLEISGENLPDHVVPARLSLGEEAGGNPESGTRDEEGAE